MSQIIGGWSRTDHVMQALQSLEYSDNCNAEDREERANHIAYAQVHATLATIQGD